MLASLANPALRRGLLFQAIFAIIIFGLLAAALFNLHSNLIARNIPTDFSFWNNTAGFDINQTLIPFSARSTYGEAFLVGLLNTLVVAAIGIFFATIIGFFVGTARLSANPILSRLAVVYVETIRNIPLLLQLLFFYNAILKPLPAPRQSLQLPFSIFLNNRGLFLPQPVLQPGAGAVALAFTGGLFAAWTLRYFAKIQQQRRDRIVLDWPFAIGLVLGPPLLMFFLAGPPLTFSYPALKGFNFTGGLQLRPEFVALVAGLSLYTASYIAEIVRAGIQSVPLGQSEAARALGLGPGLTSRLVVLPQAMRVIIPPLTSQYLNLTKNSSLAVFIGYPDLVQVFTGTVLNQTGAAVQIITITMAVYLSFSLLTSLAMNVFNRRFALAER